MIIDITSTNKNSPLLKNGTETVATVLPDTKELVVTINNVDYYSIEYYFYAEDGTKHYGETTDTYKSYQIEELIDKGTLLIKYDPKTFESIESSYKLDNSKNNGQIIIVLIFGSVSALLWVLVFGVGMTNIKRLKLEKKVLLEGKEYIATVSDINTTLTINGVPRYKIIYSWIGEDGRVVTGKTECKYFYQEAIDIKNNKHIIIRAIGPNSVVYKLPEVDNPGTNLQEILDKSEQVNYFCEYCGGAISKETKKCDSCGAKLKRHKH